MYLINNNLKIVCGNETKLISDFETYKIEIRYSNAFHLYIGKIILCIYVLTLKFN